MVQDTKERVTREVDVKIISKYSDIKIMFELVVRYKDHVQVISQI